jgi:hypothetical protein
VKLFSCDLEIKAKTDKEGKRHYTFGVDEVAECLLRQSIWHLVFPVSHLQQLTIDFTYCMWDIKRVPVPTEASLTVRSKLKFPGRLSRDLNCVTLSFTGWSGRYNPGLDRLDDAMK